MSDDRCFSDDELVLLLELAADDPRRAHVGGCPRCRARMADHASFLVRPSEAAVPGLGAIEKRMAETLRDAMDQSGDPAARQAPMSRASTRRGFSWMAWPWRLPAWAAAAAVVVVIGAALFSLRPRGFVGDTLRESPSGRPQSVEVRVRGARVEEDRIVLEWEALPGADAYRVLVLGPDLSERSRFGPFNGTSASLPEGVMTGSGAGRMLVWQVVAMRGGDPIARSPVETLSGER